MHKISIPSMFTQFFLWTPLLGTIPGKAVAVKGVTTGKVLLVTYV